jgi:hypothetical protein
LKSLFCFAYSFQHCPQNNRSIHNLLYGQRST